MSTPDCVRRAKTALAEETGRIAALTEKEIMTAATDYPLRRIKETKYDFGMGENPRRIRMQITPPKDVEYLPFLPAGNESVNVPDPYAEDGSVIATQGDKQGRGCNIPAERLYFGYDQFGRCLKAKAFETEPMCITDLLQKYAVGAFIKALRAALPRFGREFFSRELLRQVVKFAYYKFTVAEGFPISTNTDSFPAVPTGGLNIGLLRRIENLMMAQGYAKNSQTTSVNGRIALQVYAGRDAVEFAIRSRKAELNLRLESTPTVDDKTFGKLEVYEGIQFVENPLPMRGYLIEKSTGVFQFKEVMPTKAVAAGVEGIKLDVRQEYYQSSVSVGGAKYRMVEIAHIIHPDAMERQAMAVPAIEGMKFSKDFFNFQVTLLDDWRVSGKECNKDQLMFQYRMLHAYAPFPYNPELMTAICFLASTPQIMILDPNATEPAASLQPVTLAPKPAPKEASCVKCADSEEDRDPTVPACDDLFPANGVGVIRLAQVGYQVDESISGITILVERIGGNTGAASVHYATSDGTAVQPDNYDSTSGTLNWADQEFGIKSFVVPINSTEENDDGKQFNVTLSSVTGSTLGTPSTSTVTILDPQDE